MQNSSSPRAFSGPLWRPLVEIRRDQIGAYTRLAKLGDRVAFPLLFQRAHLVLHPDAVRRVLVDNVENYNKQTIGYHHLRSIIGNGLLTSEGDFWRRQRRAAQPAFHKQRIDGFARIMTDATEEIVSTWPAAGEINVGREMTALTLRVVAEALVSYDTTADAAVVGTSLGIALEHVAYRMYTPWSLPETIPTPRNRRFRRAMAALDEVVERIIAERRAGGRRGDLLDMLMEAKDDDGQGMSDVQLRDEVMTILSAGHETTAGTLTWALHLLSHHPEVEAQLRQEVERLNGRSPTVTDLPALPLVDRVILESMRLYPPAWLIARGVNRDDDLGNHPVRAGDWVLLCPYLTHRHPDLWPDPERFDPDRFLPEHTAGRHRYAYFPFSAGQRKCIGDGFAMLEARLVLATLYQQARFAAVPGHVPVPEPHITLRPRGGLPMQVTRL